MSIAAIALSLPLPGRALLIELLVTLTVGTGLCLIGLWVRIAVAVYLAVRLGLELPWERWLGRPERESA